MQSEISRQLRRKRKARVVRLRASAVVLLAAGTWSLYMAAEATSATASTLGGTATVTDPTNHPLASGGSTTLFTVALPSQAACTGDTQNGGYLVFSYLVPQGTAPTTVNFSTGDPSTGYGFVSSTGTYYGAINTAPTTGQIIGIPEFEWGPLVANGGVALSSLLYSGGTSGVWEGGIACAKSGAVSDWWNTEITFTASASDPGGFTWAAVPGTPGSSSTTTTSTTSTTSTTTTTVPSTTTTVPSTTTTVPSSTTTTLPGSASPFASSSNGSSGVTSSSSQTSGSSSASADPGSSLPFTGAPVVRYLAIGLLCIGLGFILLALTVRVRLFGMSWEGDLPG